MPFRLSSFKRGLWITVAVVLAPMLFVGLVAWPLAIARDWRTPAAIGFGSVHLSSEKRSAQRLDPHRVKEPPDFPRRPVVNCAPVSLQLRTRAHAQLRVVLFRRSQRQLVVSKKTRHDDQFGHSRRATSRDGQRLRFVNRNSQPQDPQSRLKLSPPDFTILLYAFRRTVNLLVPVFSPSPAVHPRPEIKSSPLNRCWHFGSSFFRKPYVS